MLTSDSPVKVRRGTPLLRLPLLGASFAAATATCAKDIVIAQIAPMTGVQGAAGKAYLAGLRQEFDAVNASGGSNRSVVRLASIDDAYKPDDTVGLAKETIARESPVASRTSLPIVREYLKLKPASQPIGRLRHPLA